jgi:hypothetical protein
VKIKCKFYVNYLDLLAFTLQSLWQLGCQFNGFPIFWIHNCLRDASFGNRNILIPLSDLAELLGALQPTILINFSALILAPDRTDRYLKLDSKQ